MGYEIDEQSLIERLTAVGLGGVVQKILHGNTGPFTLSVISNNPRAPARVRRWFYSLFSLKGINLSIQMVTPVVMRIAPQTDIKAREVYTPASEKAVSEKATALPAPDDEHIYVTAEEEGAVLIPVEDEEDRDKILEILNK